MTHKNVAEIGTTKSEWLGHLSGQKTGEWIDYAMHLVRQTMLLLFLILSPYNPLDFSLAVLKFSATLNPHDVAAPLL